MYLHHGIVLFPEGGVGPGGPSLLVSCSSVEEPGHGGHVTAVRWLILEVIFYN